MTKASILFYPKLDKRNSKTGKVPIYLRIIINRNKAETRLSCDVEEAELQLWNPRIMRFENNKLAANKLLNKYQQEFEELIFRNATGLNDISAKDLKDQLMGTNKNGETILWFVKEYYQNSVLKNASITPGTKKNYLKAINHLEDYLIYNKDEGLALSKADNVFGNKFMDYLLATIPEKKKTGMAQSSAAGYVKKLKAIFQRGYEEGKLERNPFNTVKLKVQSRYREKLNSNEVRILIDFNLSEFSTLDKVRNIFLFSVFTGLSYQDAIDLKSNQIQKWENGENYIYLKRIKTNVETKQFLVSFAMEIIEKYKNEPNPNGTVLPSISNQQLNLRLKILAEKTGITKELTSHIARHTFRQMLSESVIRDLAAIKTMMGHSRRNDIDSIYHSVTENQLFEAKEQYQIFLNKLLQK